MEQGNLHIEEQIRAAVDVAVKAAVTEATKGRDIGPRNLVVCIDGTANQFGVKNSNVVELYHLLIKDENQITFYNSGIGTYAKPSWRSLAYWKQVFDHNIDLMIAWNFERIVIDAYQWLSENYRNGDKIFLFGFSRGAYQVRCLSAMIERVGLIHRGNEAQIAFAYELYADTGTDSGVSEGSPTAQELATHFKQTFSREVKVHFVGAWDTVSSVGIFRDKTLPGTTSGMKHVGFFRHALALDERRVKFLPEYAHEGSFLGDTPERVHDGTTAENRTLPKRESNLHTKEVWFAGTHSDIGGGNDTNLTMDRSRPSLRWMSYEATAVGLRMRPFPPTKWDFEAHVVVNESLNLRWWALELVPWSRLTYRSERDSTIRPHKGMGRRPREGQMLHSSLLHQKETNLSYEPKASLKYMRGGPESWIEFLSLKDSRPFPSYVERDLLDLALELVNEIRVSATSRDPYEILKRFVDLASSADGLRALREIPEIFSKLQEVLDKPLPVTFQTHALRVIRLLVEDDEYLYSEHNISSIARSSDGRYLAIVRSFGDTIDLCDTDAEQKVLRSYKAPTDGIISLAFSPEGDRIVFGLCDHSVYLWYIEASAPRFIHKHDGAVGAIGFSPDSAYVASGSVDGIIMISPLDLTDTVAAEPLLGHTSSITSLAFSPDGTLLASGSLDHSIRLWRLSNTLDLPLPPQLVLDGHTGAIISLLLSADNDLLVSGSYDCTVRVWELQSSDTRIRVLYGHTGWITSLAFSQEGERIVSGSTDSTCRLWEAQTGRLVNPPIKPFDEWVSSVNFTPDGKSIVVYSIDGVMNSMTIDISEINHAYLFGHASEVLSVAFSPDSKQLVSCSLDNTIRVWDVQTGIESFHPLEGHTDLFTSVQFSSDGSLIASGSYDGTVRIWDAVTGKQKGEPLRGHTKGVISVGFSPDGKHLVSGADDCIRKSRICYIVGVFFHPWFDS